jgi:hypothetical protein
MLAVLTIPLAIAALTNSYPPPEESFHHCRQGVLLCAAVAVPVLCH